jgi:hypothetical protein
VKKRVQDEMSERMVDERNQNGKDKETTIQPKQKRRSTIGIEEAKAQLAYLKDIILRLENKQIAESIKHILDMRFESSGIIIQENIIDYSFRRTTIFSFFR